MQKRLRAAKYEVENNIHAKPDKITVDTWFNTWIEEYKQNSVERETLEKHRKEQLEYKLLLGDKWQPVEGLANLVFTGEHGNPVNAKGVAKSFSLLIAKINNKVVQSLVLKVLNHYTDIDKVLIEK